MPRSSTRAASHNGASAKRQRAPSTRRQGERRQSGEPDVVLNVPDLHVDEIDLDVENLEAHLALEARLANLLELRAGAHVEVAKVQLTIKGVAAKALLKVRLENVYAILDRALTSIDRNPQILEGVIDTLDDTLGPAGAVGGTIEGVSRTVTSRASRGNLARLGGGLRNLHRGSGGNHRVATLAAAAGLIGGAALAARGNGGIEKTIKDVTA